ncbi:MAG: aspartate/tyrosine/aromatic aminotransferase [Ideonella sp.]|nr:aspartate/tyrosine/aromatic aminotransferase [Ideonella sp.]
MFEHVEPFPGDPILALLEVFNADARPHKVNLGIGIYFDEDGRIPVLDCVRQAEARIAQEGGAKPYLPIEGLPAMRAEVQKLLFGADHPLLASGRLVTIQTVGSSGGLKVGADFLRRWFPASGVWVSDPTWDNHRSMFEGAGLPVDAYPYYDPATGGVRFDAMCEALRKLPPRSVVLLHACCHNPTGVDLSRAQWDTLVPLLRERELLPYLDLAYQGFGDGVEEDAYAVRRMADAGLSFFVANSFSKSMSVYGESSPPMHSGRLVAQVLGDPALRALWLRELAAMRERMLTMRQALHDTLLPRVPGRDLSYVLTQRGMFSYTGLSGAQVDRLREQYGVYLVRSGRLCIAGLNRGNVERTAGAMAAVMAG